MFSVCISVYINDKPQDFRVAMNSVIQQTLPPSEIVLVVDGPICKELEEVIEELKNEEVPLKVIQLKENKGHAIARQTGIENVSYDLVAIMDSDDIAEPDRFEKQIKCFEKEPDLSVLGGQIDEFVDSIDNVVGIRGVPLEHHEICQYLKSRCPMNQVTVMMKKKDVLSVGGYCAWYCDEDYYLWIRMLQAGYKFSNLSDRLVHVRVGKEMYSRRGGMKYFKSEARLQKYMWNKGIINVYRYMFNVSIRIVVQVFMPNALRSIAFQKLFRKSKF